ncbi:MAG: NRDE family protein [Gammaproteobacteria bacterium]
MCLLVLAWQSRPGFSVILAGNRDEFHDRPAASADWWDDSPGVLGGRDLRAGGTWLAVSRAGRWAVVTNYREPMEEGRGPRSRGELVAGFVAGDTPPRTFAGAVADRGDDYGGFNLLLGDTAEAVYVSNRGRGPETLAPGMYGLSNHLLDTPWPKLTRVRERFRARLTGEPDPAGLLEILADPSPAPDRDLPQTGLELQWERLLSAPFIRSPLYGTRCSTVLRLHTSGDADFTERRFDSDGRPTGESRFEFTTSPERDP